MSTTSTAQPAPPRQCGDCAMCCKLPQITDLQKPANTWCTHCTSHKSCGNYDHRPQMCRDFFCLFITTDALGEEWRPSHARFLLTMKETNLDRHQLVVMVDPAYPDAWRKEPYFSNLKRWSAEFYVILTIGDHWRALFPEHEVDLGLVGTQDVLEYIDEVTGRGLMRSIRLKKAA